MQKTADCQAPVYATDQLVCGDDDLRAIDIQLVAALQSADQRATDGLEPFLEPQGDWLRRRSMCAFESDHRGCVVDAYRERLTVLLGMERLEKASMSPGFACEKTDGAANLLAQWVSPAALAIIEDREVVGIALRAVEGGSSWQPYLSISGERQLAITRGGSTILSCAAA